MLSYEKIIKRFGAAKANKQQWETILRDCYRYAMPQRNTIDNYMKGSKKRELVFDSTAEEALEDFATRMESELVPPNINWMKLESGTDIPPDEEEQVTKYLEQTTDIVFNHINSSNFSSQIHTAFLDLGISTGALIVEAGDGIQSSLNFRCVSLSELILEQTQRGTVETVFREFKIPIGDIPYIWEDAKLSDTMLELLEKDGSKEVDIIEGVIETDDGFEMFVIYQQNKHFLVQKKLESNPWVIFRESTIPGETMGRGRVMRALADIKTLNVVVKDWLESLRWYASPTFTATDDGIINPHTYRMKPGTVNAVGSNTNENPTLRALQVGGAPALVIDTVRMLQDNIRRVMISKPFGDIQEQPVRTATEMSIRNADMAKTSLGASGRIQNELLERLVARCVYVLKEAGKIADFRVDGREVAIKFTSPSSRSQDEQTLAAIGRAMEMYAAFPPELIMQEIAIERFPGEIIDILGLPASFKRTEEEKMERAQQQQEQAMADRQAAVQMQAMEDAK